MCVIVFDLCFMYNCSGWEGSTNDLGIRFQTPAEDTITTTIMFLIIYKCTLYRMRYLDTIVSNFVGYFYLVDSR